MFWFTILARSFAYLAVVPIRLVERAFSFEGTGLDQWRVDNVEIMYNMFGQGEGVGITGDILFDIAMLYILYSHAPHISSCQHICSTLIFLGGRRIESKTWAGW